MCYNSMLVHIKEAAAKNNCGFMANRTLDGANVDKGRSNFTCTAL
jgi:hypothetical protein